MQLPEQLREALEEQVEGIPARHITVAVEALSARYRQGASGPSLLRSEADVAAYLAYRFPATFAAAAAVFTELRVRQPNVHPTSLLDLGGGPGTAAWAAALTWPDLRRIEVLERDAGMIRAGRELVARSHLPALREATWTRADVAAPWGVDRADLTVTAYTLGELPDERRPEVLRRLWECTATGCVIIEPGTPRGSDLIGRAEEELVRAGAHLVAPIPHGWRRTEGEGDWCHFSVRVPRTRLHRRTKGATLPYEDEKFAYLIASREPAVPIAARVLRHPQIRSGHIRLVLATPDGVRRLTITRKDRDAFRHARDLRWGDAIVPRDAHLFGLSG